MSGKFFKGFSGNIELQVYGVTCRYRMYPLIVVTHLDFKRFLFLIIHIHALYRGSRDFSDIPPRHPHFTKKTMRNIADLTGGKLIAV
jgi:hypothetical protein